jgi:hypothetical protein
LSPQCGDNFRVWKSFCEANHVVERLLAKTASVTRLQLTAYRCEQFSAVLGSASFKDVCPDATSDLPVQSGERRIRSDRNLTLGILN